MGRHGIPVEPWVWWPPRAVKERNERIDADVAKHLAGLVHGAGLRVETELRRTLREQGRLLIGKAWRTIARRRKEADQ